MNSARAFARSMPVQAAPALLAIGLLLCGCGDASPGEAGEGPGGALPGALTFEGRFSGTQAVPPTSSGATGAVRVTLNASRTELSYSVRHSVAAALGAGLYRGSMGEPGAIVAPIEAAADVTGKLAVGPAEVAELLAGTYFVSVASAAFASGEVRAQLLGVGAASKTEGAVSLSAALGEERPPAQQPAQRGAATFSFEPRTGELTYQLQLGLSGAVEVRLGQAAVGAEGAALLTLSGASGKVVLDEEARLLLRSGLLYLEARAGARVLRGQIVAGRTLPFSVSLAPAALVVTSARGRAHFTLSPDRTKLAFRLQHDAAEVTGASISRGLLGLGGRAVCTLKSGEDGAQGLCDIQAQGGLDVLLLGDLLGGDLRVNVTTRAHLLGELQGLLTLPL